MGRVHNPERSVNGHRRNIVMGCSSTLNTSFNAFIIHFSYIDEIRRNLALRTAAQAQGSNVSVLARHLDGSFF